jgi:hypothetical protein
VVAYDSREKIPSLGQIRITQRNALTLQQRQDKLAKDHEKLVKASQTKLQIKRKMEDLLDYSVQMDVFKDRIREFKIKRMKNCFVR